MDISDADELPPSPEFGQLQVTVTPPEGPDGGQPLEPTLPTPEFGESEKLKVAEATKAVAESPKFGSATPASPTFGEPDSPEAPAAPEAVPLAAPREQVTIPSTPDFGSADERKSSTASSPQGSSCSNSPDAGRGKRLSVDMLLPSPASPNERREKARFDFAEEVPDLVKQNKELMQECLALRLEKKKDEQMLSWYYEEYEEYEEFMDEQSRQRPRLVEMEELAQEHAEVRKRLQAQLQEQSVQVLDDQVKEARQRQQLQQEALTSTLRLENDDLAAELRDLQERLTQHTKAAQQAEEQGAALEASLQQAVAKTQRAEAAASSASQKAQRAEARAEAAWAAEAEAAQEQDSSATREVKSAMDALARSRQEMEEVTGVEWRAAEAFDRVADLSRELKQAQALADSESQRHSAQLAALRADAQVQIAAVEQQAADLAVRLKVANSEWKDAQARLELASACRSATSDQKEELFETRIQDLEARLASEASCKLRAEKRLEAEEVLARQLQSDLDNETSAKREAAKASKSLDLQLARATACEHEAEARLQEAEGDARELQRALREAKRQTHEAEQEAESSGGQLGAALGAKQRLEAQMRILQASLEAAESSASSGGSVALKLQGQLGEAKLQLQSQAQQRQLAEAQLGQLEDSLNQLQGELKSSGEARRSVEAQLGETKLQLQSETQRRQLAEAQLGPLQDSLGRLKAELKSSTEARRGSEVALQESRDSAKELVDFQLTEKHAAFGLEASERKSTELSEELGAERRSAAKRQALLGSLELQLEVEQKGKEAAQDAFGRAQEAANSLECQLASAGAVLERLKEQQVAEGQGIEEFAAALGIAREEQAEQGEELGVLREELDRARSQRRAAMQASERAQLARLEQHHQLEAVEAQAIRWKKQTLLEEAARSSSVSSLLEESSAVVREQQAELVQEVKCLHAELAQNASELSTVEDDCTMLKYRLTRAENEAQDFEKSAESEQECCRMLLQQLEELAVQSIAGSQAPISRREAAQVRQLQSEAAAVRRELQQVRGAAQVLASSMSSAHIGGDPPQFVTPRTAPRAGFVSSLPLSASVISSSSLATAGSEWPLPWGPPPAVVKDLVFPASPASCRDAPRD
ncbi:unnamed protein product [Effrenium voratum]|uniref:Uncharacterized protein n=1 Tax=Effrenium voratum TaxID=2562239 RepID=A0AA36MV00_9DINO|nr:unnamed protein product [Effrenium voratum]